MMQKFKTKLILCLLTAALIGCKSQDTKTAFLDIDGKNSASSVDFDSDLMSSIKTNLLRNNKSLLVSEPQGIELFCSSYKVLSKSETLDFWSMLIYTITQNLETLDSKSLGCENSDADLVDVSACVGQNLNHLLIVMQNPVDDILSEELSAHVNTSKICNL